MKVSGVAHKPGQAIKNIRGTPLSYDTGTRFENGAYQTIVTAHCIECGEAHELHWNTGGADPAYVQRKFIGMGWRFDVYKPKNCICPVCVKGRKQFAEAADEAARRERDGVPMPVPVELSEELMKTSGITTGRLSAVANSIKGIVEVPATATAVASIGRLTRHQKSRIRELLDTNFDDEKGRYIDGYDDQRIGAEVDVPWALVTEIREFAYGPIKDDPAVASFKQELAAMTEELKTLSSAVEAMRARVEAFSGKLVNLEAKAKKL